MHRTSKYLALALGLIVSAVILVFALRGSRRPATGFDVQVATNTCASDSTRIVVLRISSGGGFAINSESVPSGQLASRLREIYGTRAERVLYLFPENDTSTQRIADVIDVVQHLQTEETKGIPLPRELRTAHGDMNIQMKLVTSGALSAPCPKNCFNWAAQGLPVTP